MAFISTFACEKLDFGLNFFFGQSLPDFFEIAIKPSKRSKKQVKNWKDLNLSTCSPSDTYFEEPQSICCYLLATPATYFAKRAKKSKIHHIWLIFRKKGSATPEMCPMGVFRMFPHQITWKSNLWKLSRKSHLEYSHGLLNNGTFAKLRPKLGPKFGPKSGQNQFKISSKSGQKIGQKSNLLHIPFWASKRWLNFSYIVY